MEKLLTLKNKLENDINLIIGDPVLQERYDLNQVQDHYNRVCKEIKKTYENKLEKAKIHYNDIIDGLPMEWHDWARSLYIVSENFTVKSNAKNWKEDRLWYCSNELEAIEKVNTLIQYKICDRQRGHGDVNEDLTIT